MLKVRAGSLLQQPAIAVGFVDVDTGFVCCRAAGPSTEYGQQPRGSMACGKHVDPERRALSLWLRIADREHALNVERVNAELLPQASMDALLAFRFALHRQPDACTFAKR